MPLFAKGCADPAIIATLTARTLFLDLTIAVCWIDVYKRQEGYYVSTVGLNEATIKKYIQEQEKHDIALDKLSVKEYEDPFKGC